jgi:hypothetical protein
MVCPARTYIELWRKTTRSIAIRLLIGIILLDNVVSTFIEDAIVSTLRRGHPRKIRACGGEEGLETAVDALAHLRGAHTAGLLGKGDELSIIELGDGLLLDGGNALLLRTGEDGGAINGAEGAANGLEDGAGVPAGLLIARGKKGGVHVDEMADTGLVDVAQLVVDLSRGDLLSREDMFVVPAGKVG